MPALLAMCFASLCWTYLVLTCKNKPVLVLRHHNHIEKLHIRCTFPNVLIILAGNENELILKQTDCFLFPVGTNDQYKLQVTLVHLFLWFLFQIRPPKLKYYQRNYLRLWTFDSNPQ